MGIELHLAAAEQISNSLKNHPEKYSDNEIDKIVSNLGEILHDIESQASQGFTPLTKLLRNETIAVLEDLALSIDSVSQKSELHKIADVRTRILEIKATVESAPVYKEKKVKQLEVIPIAFFCDLDCPDHNGAIYSGLKNALVQQIPFVTTRSLLRASGQDGEMAGTYLLNEALLLKEKDNWDIYQRGEMLVFMPRSLHPDKSPQEKLQALDFQTDGRLKTISVNEALQGAQKECDIDDFTSLFVPKPQANKLFYLAGHGSATTVGALKLKNFRKYLDFLDIHGSGGSAITSCSSGGSPTLSHIRESSLEANFFEREKPHSFPTIVLSIGDFSTLSKQEGEQDLKGLLSAFAAFSGNTIDPSYVKLRKKMDEIMGGRAKVTANSIKLYPAHSAGIPVGFRPLDEGQKGFSITYTSVKKAELIDKALFNKKVNESKVKDEKIQDSQINDINMTPKSTIRVPSAIHVEVNPLVVSVPIEFTKSNPILLSMMPGKGHHYIHSFQLAAKSQETPMDFIKKTVDFHRVTHAHHGFFIGEIKGQNKTIQDVVLYLHPQGACCLWREGEKYYMSNSKGEPKEISPLAYELCCYDIQQATCPLKKAIRALSAGQEREEDFAAHITPQFVSSRFHSLFDETKKPIACVPNILEVIKDNTLQEKEALVLFLLNRKDVDTAFKIYQSVQMDPNIKDYQGNPLLNLVIEDHADEFFEYLLQQNVDVNVVNALGFPTLTRAIGVLTNLYDPQTTSQEESKEIIQAKKIFELLLNHPSINLEAKNKWGWTPLAAALPHRELVKKLIDKEASINPISKQNLSALAYFVRINDMESVELLLEFKAELNHGKHSPLTEAIYNNNLPMINRLLEAGTKAFEADAAGKVPFMEAILKASPEIVKTLMEQKDCDLAAEGKESPMRTALISGNDEKIKLLLDKRAPLPENGIGSKVIYKRLLLSHDDSTFQKLIENNQQEGFQNEVSSVLYKNHMTLWKELVEAGKIIPAAALHAALSNLPEKKQESCQWLIDSGIVELNGRMGATTLFGRIVQNGDTSLIEYALSKGAKVNVDDPKVVSPLGNLAPYSKSLNKNFKLLVEAGADINALKPDRTTPFYIALTNGDRDLIQYCLSHGAKVNIQDANDSPLRTITNGYSFNLETFKMLVKAGADLNAVSKDNKTPFCDIIERGDMELVKYCIENGAKILPETRDAISPLAIAAKLKVGSKTDPAGKIFKFLFEESNGDLNAPAAPAKRYSSFNPATIFADLIDNGNIELIEWALQHGADVNPPLQIGQESPLAAALGQDDSTIFRKLLDLGASIHTLGESSFRVCKYGDIPLLEKLMEQGLTIAKDKEQNALHISSYCNQPRMLRYLLEKGFVPDYAKKLDARLFNNDDETELLQTLLDYGYSPNNRIPYTHKTSFQFMLERPTPPKKVIKLLLENGVSPRQECDGTTSIYHAVGLDDPELVQMLLDHGADADINIKNAKTGQTALELARAKGNLAIISLLEKDLDL